MIEQVFSPAKINLFLHVTARRKDGYHELYSLMTCLDFGDILEFDFTGSGVTVLCDHPDVPEDESNLVHRAASLFFYEFFKMDSFERKKPGVQIAIHKKIPIGAGLGGGSSNAAATLQVLNKRFGFPFSKDVLMAMGLKLGADVPFFIHGGPAIARGIGEKLSFCTPLVPYSVVVFFPGFNVQTSLVYKNVNLALTKKKKTNNNAPLNMFGKDWIKDGKLDVKGLLHNDLEYAAYKLYPDLFNIRKEMVAFEPDGLLMTGSGSSFFAIFSEVLKAEQMFHALSEQVGSEQLELTGKRVFLTSFL